MALVEWTRRDGEQIEALVAMLVNRERVNSARITPSAGDGGVDILERGAGANGGDAVYQVKRYAEPLDSKQKTAVEESYERLFSDPRWADLNVTTWYLVVPWSPTPEAAAWLQSLGSERNVQVVWHGLDYVEGLVAKYPDVVDYYFNDGRSRIEEIYGQVMSMMGLEQLDEAVDVPAITARMRKAVDLLDHDPHYRYELHFGEGEFPAVVSRPGLVMTTVAGVADGGKWTAVDIIARCAASTEVRPITITGTLSAEAGSEFESTLRDFLKYGTPFESPEGAYNGTLDAPGGLGGAIDGAKVFTLSLDRGKPTQGQIHVEIVNPVGAVLGSVELNKMDQTQGEGGGVRIVLEESHGVFTIEDRVDGVTGEGSRSLRLEELAGMLAVDVHPALTFLLNCQPPNVGRVSLRGTPTALGSIDTGWSFDFGDDESVGMRARAAMVGWLAEIQEHTATPIRLPAPADMSAGQVQLWERVASILTGGEVTTTYPEGQWLIVELGEEITFPQEEIGVRLPFTVQVGREIINLGEVAAWLKRPVLHTVTRRGNHVFHCVTTPRREVSYRQL